MIDLQKAFYYNEEKVFWKSEEETIRAVVDVLQERLDIDFREALKRFYSSETYVTLQNVENGFWAESAEFIADRYMDEIETGVRSN